MSRGGANLRRIGFNSGTFCLSCWCLVLTEDLLDLGTKAKTTKKKASSDHSYKYNL